MNQPPKIRFFKRQSSEEIHDLNPPYSEPHSADFVSDLMQAIKGHDNHNDAVIGEIENKISKQAKYELLFSARIEIERMMAANVIVRIEKKNQ